MRTTALSQITLLQGYYKYLSLSMFLDYHIKFDGSFFVEDTIRISTWEKTAIALNTSMIQKILADIRKHPDKKNIFGYLSTISGLRGVFSVMKDFMQQDDWFERFLKELLGVQFSSFQKILYFCRNVLSHHINADIVLTREDYEKQMLMLNQTPHLKFDMLYKDVFWAVWKGKDTYGLSIDIDTKNIKEWQKYADIVGWHEQWLLAELCYNFSEYYKAMKLSRVKSTPVKTSASRSRTKRDSRTRHTSGERKPRG